MLLPVLLVIALTIYALFDVWGTPKAQVRQLPQSTWVVVVVTLPVLGPLAWLVAGRAQTAGDTPASPPTASAAPDAPTKPTRLTIPDVLPDVGLDPDDPEDRWLIEQRDQQRAKRAGAPPADAALAADPAGDQAMRPAEPPGQQARPPQPRGPGPGSTPRDAEPPASANGT